MPPAHSGHVVGSQVGSSTASSARKEAAGRAVLRLRAQARRQTGTPGGVGLRYRVVLQLRVQPFHLHAEILLECQANGIVHGELAHRPGGRGRGRRLLGRCGRGWGRSGRCRSGRRRWLRCLLRGLSGNGRGREQQGEGCGRDARTRTELNTHEYLLHRTARDGPQTQRFCRSDPRTAHACPAVPARARQKRSQPGTRSAVLTSILGDWLERPRLGPRPAKGCPRYPDEPSADSQCFCRAARGRDRYASHNEYEVRPRSRISVPCPRRTMWSRRTAGSTGFRGSPDCILARLRLGPVPARLPGVPASLPRDA